MDIYQPAVLNRVVQDLKAVARPPLLLGRYFTETSLSTNGDTIYFDQLTGKPRLAPFCSPLVAGRVVQGRGYKTSSFKPAYIKDKRVLEDGKPVRRPAGAPIAGPLDTMQVRSLQLAQESQDQIEMLGRRKEWMASEVLRTGKVTVSGEGYPTTVVDFGRDAGLTVTLAGGARWDQVTATPMDDLETWAGLVRDSSGANAIDVVMANDVWNLFRKFDDVKDLLSKLLNLDGDRTAIKVGPDAQKLGYSEKGKVGDYNVTVYADSYTDDNGATAKFLPDNWLMMVGQIEGVQHHGQIKDEKAGFQALDYYQKSWTVEDPAARYLMLQSAPLVVPYRVNACLAAKVK